MSDILKDMASRVLVASGAQGTELAKQGFPLGGNYGAWVLEHPRALKDICLSYMESGIDIFSAAGCIHQGPHLCGCGRGGWVSIR